MAKYKNKYRIESNRRPNWDYSSNGLYFLTIVTENRICNLGEIVDDLMLLSDFGEIIEIEWYKSFDIRAELFLDEFQIMPNHLHTIVEIVNSGTKSIDNGENGVRTTGIVDINQTDGRPFDIMAETHGRASLPINGRASLPIKRNPPVRLPKSISSFMGGFKSAVNTKIDNYIDEHQLKIPKYNEKNHFFQPNYHDHIIRNHEEYLRIKKYIQNNPRNWNTDRLK